jgi:hypothetical protein
MVVLICMGCVGLIGCVGCVDRELMPIFLLVKDDNTCVMCT